MTKVVVLDPGHGGSDPGAIGHGLNEADVVLDIAKRTKKILENDYTGLKVYLTRSTDKTVSLEQRSAYANKLKADCFVSIHNNSFSKASANGYEDYVWTKAAANSSGRLQKIIHKHMSGVMKKYGITNRGKKKANFWVVRKTNMKAILLEILFISNKKENSLLRDSKFKQACAEAIAAGIAEVEGLKKKVTAPKPKPDPKPAPKPAPKPGKDLHRVKVDGKQVGAYKEDKNVVDAVKQGMKKNPDKIQIEKVK